ncbi:MAG TPA: sigma-70 family RNA polymerase sigma factor [Acidimicrobiia bacterium]|nr:sigma-70 family RNA polymerase sigma factor [Acidimicrobiia bacterium]
MSAAAESHGERVERFRLLYDAAYPRILAYALRRARSREDAFDAVSETFAAVWRRLDDVPGDERQIAWVYGVARRVLANQYRGADRRRRLDERMAVTATPAADPDLGLVHEALDRLRPDDREILTLSAWDDLDNDEIAVVLGITAAAAAVRLHRARRRLAVELDRVGMKKEKSVKSTTRSRTPQVVQGTQPGPGEVDRE